MSHIYHPDLGDPARKGILVDGCEDCESSAKNPVQRLDRNFIRALWAKMVAVEHFDGVNYSSHAEATAGNKLHDIALFLEQSNVMKNWWELEL